MLDDELWTGGWLVDVRELSEGGGVALGLPYGVGAVVVRIGALSAGGRVMLLRALSCGA